METFTALLALCEGNPPRSLVDSSHKGQWRGALLFFVSAWIDDWTNNLNACDLICHRAHYDVPVTSSCDMATWRHGIFSLLLVLSKGQNCGALALFISWTSCWTKDRIAVDLTPWHWPLLTKQRPGSRLLCILFGPFVSLLWWNQSCAM